MASTSAEGGFLHDALPSPAPTTYSSRLAANLPHPRSQPLRPGSQKEDATRRFVDQKLLHVSRRYVKKFQAPEEVAGDGALEGGLVVGGYTEFGEVCRDLAEVVDVLWLSGTRKSY
jgi:hypothetical protein